MLSEWQNFDFSVIVYSNITIVILTTYGAASDEKCCRISVIIYSNITVILTTYGAANDEKCCQNDRISILVLWYIPI